jgi:hypothetical protein
MVRGKFDIVPQIMEPWLIAGAARPADPGMLAQVWESLLHELCRYRPPAQDEERCAASLHVASPVSTRAILHRDPI